jgi:hypothetical protein
VNLRRTRPRAEALEDASFHLVSKNGGFSPSSLYAFPLQVEPAGSGIELVSHFVIGKTPLVAPLRAAGGLIQSPDFSSLSSVTPTLGSLSTALCGEAPPAERAWSASDGVGLSADVVTGATFRTGAGIRGGVLGKAAPGLGGGAFGAGAGLGMAILSAAGWGVASCDAAILGAGVLGVAVLRAAFG